MALLSVVNVMLLMHHESFPVKNYIGWNPRKLSPANISPFTVLCACVHLCASVLCAHTIVYVCVCVYLRVCMCVYVYVWV